MTTHLPVFPKVFVTPDANEAPSSIRVLTTTRLLPETPVRKYAAVTGDVPWPPTTHGKGGALETAFAQHGHALHRLLPAAPLWLQQVHGTDVIEIDDTTNTTALRQTPPVADAVVTRTPDAVLAILTADCLPVVIAAENGTVLAAAHAGWRGLAAGILENTVRLMACPPEQLSAWLGPAISSTAFEVGEDVFQAFDAANDRETAACFVPTETPAKWHADLYALARLRLQRLGISKIGGGTWCTYRDAARFFSYRRQRDEGRMATFAWLSSI